MTVIQMRFRERKGEQQACDSMMEQTTTTMMKEGRLVHPKFFFQPSDVRVDNSIIPDLPPPDYKSGPRLDFLPQTLSI